MAYFQDDYNTAIAQLTSAYDNLDSTDLKAWCLYRIGLSQQRQGKFEDADKTFALVQQNHAGTVPAQRAHDRQGARAFYVQLATFAQPASADRAIADLKKQGVTATRVASPEGHALLRVGPIASYTQAAFMKEYRREEGRLDAVIFGRSPCTNPERRIPSLGKRSPPGSGRRPIRDAVRGRTLGASRGGALFGFARPRISAVRISE